MPNQHENHHREIIKHISQVSGNIPTHRKASKHSYSFSQQSFAEQLSIWNHAWNHSPHFRVKLHAFFFLEQHMKRKETLEQMWPVIIQWQDSVDDWPLCDSLSKIYTRILELFPARMYKIAKAWNSDADLWKRRQSIVSLLYYSRTKKSYLPFDKIEKLLSSLLKDKEYYVQKGVGWTLREMYTVYPEETSPYFVKHIKSISSIAFTIAIEKMNAHKKVQLKALRKK